MKTRQLQKRKYIKKPATGRSQSASGRQKPARTFNSEIGGLLIMSSGILVGLSLYSNGLTGIFGDIIKVLLRGMLGLPSYAIPAMITIWGLFHLFRRVDEEFSLRMFYGIVLMVLSSGLIHTAYMSSIKEAEIYSINDFLTIMGRYFMDAASYKEINGLKIFALPEGGGIIGAVLSIPLLWVFKSAGTFVILYTLFIIFIILLTNISLVNFVRNLRELFMKFVGFIVYIFTSQKIKPIAKAKNAAVKKEEAAVADDRLNEQAVSASEDPFLKVKAAFQEKGPIDIFDKLSLIESKRKRADRADSEAEADLVQEQKPEEILPFEDKPADKAFENKLGIADQEDEPEIILEESSVRLIADDLKNQARIKKSKKDDEAKVIPLDLHRKEVEWENGRNYVFPPLELLKENAALTKDRTSKSTPEDHAKKLEDTLASFGVSAKVIHVSKGPTVTRYELQPSSGVKVKTIVNLADDIALNLAASGVRIEAPIPGKAAIGIEVPNKEINAVFLREVVESPAFLNYPSKLAFAVGKNIAGEAIVADIAKMPHLLIAGATGSGKSVCINTLITSILYKASPKEVKLVMIDPKVVELGVYNGIPHLLIPVVTEPKKAAGALNWAVQEMVSRYKLFAEKGVRDLKGYNAMLKEHGEESILPQIVIIIDELADLMMVAPNDVEDAICRLAQMARAAGMHLVIATQRPSVDVITGVIKANIPSRISFAVSSQIDSRTILDMAGAEKLLGKGDMLFYPVGEPKPVRVQCPYISEKEVEAVIDHIKGQFIAEYNDDVIEKINNSESPEKEDNAGDNDEFLPQAIELVVDAGQASASLIQRKFKVGYARAARIIDQMEARGIVGRHEGSKPRQVLISKQQWMEMTMGDDQ